jgi:hypothetical protein
MKWKQCQGSYSHCLFFKVQFSPSYFLITFFPSPYLPPAFLWLAENYGCFYFKRKDRWDLSSASVLVNANVPFIITFFLEMSLIVILCKIVKSLYWITISSSHVKQHLPHDNICISTPFKVICSQVGIYIKIITERTV